MIIKQYKGYVSQLRWQLSFALLKNKHTTKFGEVCCSKEFDERWNQFQVKLK